VDRLKQGNHGQTTNALVAQVFQVDPDLDRATDGRPLAPDMACLTQLQFKPKKDHLNLYATFRSQYFDTKCYGNLLSLAMLLAIVCDRTGYDPGILVETVHNTTLRSTDDAIKLNADLRKTSTSWRMQTPKK
jgi:thymidylate synthase